MPSTIRALALAITGVILLARQAIVFSQATTSCSRCGEDSAPDAAQQWSRHFAIQVNSHRFLQGDKSAKGLIHLFTDIPQLCARSRPTSETGTVGRLFAQVDRYGWVAVASGPLRQRPLTSNAGHSVEPCSILASWESAFPGSLPAGYLCRHTVSSRWLRIHSLPGSKRYAETEREYQEILHRNYAAARMLLGEHEACFLVVMRFGEDGAWNESEADVALPKIMTHFMQAGDEDDEIHFFGTPLTWGEAKHDSLLRAVADDRTGRVMIFNPARRAAFAPYDGGADLFFPTEFDVSVARNKFGAWLSPHPDGL